MGKLNVVLDWFANTNHTGFLLAEKRGYFAEAGLEVHIDGEVHGVMDLHGADFVLGPQISMLDCMSRGVELTGVAVLTQRSDSGIVSLKESGITSPRHLEGKRLTHWAPRWFHGVIGEAVRLDGGDYGKVELVPMDVGDIVGVSGHLFHTKTGELTISCRNLKLITRSMRPLPEKYHGLKDMETRYRQRYVDLIVTERAREIFRKRSMIVSEFRRFLEERGFMEVETPMMQAVAGGAAARPFETYHNALDLKLYMRIAPELYLKRLLVGGFEKVFELNRNFRNEGIDTRHNPEFTSCEFYWAYANFHDLMDLTEELFARLANKVCGGTVITYQGQEIDLTPGKWTRMSFYESLTKIGGHSPEFYNDYNKVRDYIRSRGEKATDSESLPKLHAKLFDLDVEEKLIQPHFIYHYPTEISPLSRRNNEHPDLTDRFELFITGRELANAFSELNDPVDQRLRFEEQVREKEAGDDEAHAMDEDFLRALEYGMPPAAGEGIGIDRLVMLLTDSASIREVILFPLLRPEF